MLIYNLLYYNDRYDILNTNMENYKSKYFNTNNFDDWDNKVLLLKIVQYLENIDINILQEIVSKCGIKFEGNNENVMDKEQLIYVLFGHDIKREKLLQVLNEYTEL